MTQVLQFCTLQMGNFLQLECLQKINGTCNQKSANRAETDKQATNGGN